MNDPGLWIACSFMVVMTLIQAFLYLKKGIKLASDMGFKKEVINKCIRSATIASIGPSCAIGVSVVALMGLIGGPMAWQRLSVVGSLVYETLTSNIAASALGVTTETMTPDAFAAVAWAMGLAGCFWQLNVILFAPSYDKGLKLITKGDTKLLNVIVLSTMMAVFSRQLVPYMMNMASVTRPFAAAGIGAVLFLVLLLCIKRFKLGWLHEWALPIAMFVAMFAALLFPKSF